MKGEVYVINFDWKDVLDCVVVVLSVGESWFWILFVWVFLFWLKFGVSIEVVIEYNYIVYMFKNNIWVSYGLFF